MKLRFVSVLLVFLLVASAFVPAVSAGSPVEDVVKAVGDGVKGAWECTHEVIKEVTKVNKMAITSPEMQDIYVKGAIGAAAGGAAGTAAGPGGTVAGATIGGVANVIDGCYEKVRK